MNTIRDLIARLMALEPALVISTVSGILLILANFGVAPAVDVPAAVMTVFNLLAILATVLGIRQNVYSPDTTQAIAERAADTGNVDIGDPPKGVIGGA